MLLLGSILMLGFTFRDIHTQGNPDKVRPTHLSLEMDLDFKAKTIKGVCTLTLAYADGAAADHVDLDTAVMTIASVQDAKTGDDLKFELGSPVKFLGQRLRVFLGGGKPERIRVAYRTGPGAAALQWLTPQQTTSGKYPFLFTQSQSILARTWIPCVDSPGERVTYDAIVRVPKGLTAVMSARHGQHDPEKGVFRFEMSLAIPPYLIALAAGELAFQPLSERTGVYAEPAVLKKAAWEFADMEKMVQVTESLYGAYRWDRWDAIVLPPSFPFGGMENPMLTFATPTIIAGDRSLMGLMAHELAHSWSGNLVTNATWSDFWLNEGYTSYIEKRIDEAVYGKPFADMQKLLGQRDLIDSLKDLPTHDTIMHVDLSGRDPDEGFTDIPYEKGANFLTVLEHHFGRERFDAFLRKYFDTYAFKSITTAASLAFMKRELFQGDEDLWKKLRVDEWVYRPGLPPNMVVPKSDRFEKTRAAAEAFAKDGSLDGVQKDWVTAQWQDFLNSLPRVLAAEKLDLLEQRFKLSQSGNSEILFAWFEIAIPSNYEPAFAAIESFLTRQGRRKFLKPLYQALWDNPKTRKMAKDIYQKARPTYHPISFNSIDAIVK